MNRTHRPLIQPLFALLGACMLTLAPPAADAASANARRLQVQIDFTRRGDVQNGAERGRQKLVQQWSLNALLQGDGTPMVNNPLDPDDSRRQLERAQQTQQKVAAAQARVRGNAAAAPAQPDLAAMQAQAQQLQARCGTDRDCLMREAMALSAANVGGRDAGVQQRLQAYGQAVQACDKTQPAVARRDACVADARRRAGGGDEGPADDAVDTPYLMFTGATACGLELSARVDGRVEGQYNDVQGVVRYTETERGEGRLRDDASCPALQAVLDTRSGRVWTSTSLVPARLGHGSFDRTDQGRKPQHREGPIVVNWMEAGDWIAQRLSRLDAAGSDQTRLPVAGGFIDVKMSWRFAAP